MPVRKQSRSRSTQYHQPSPEDGEAAFNAILAPGEKILWWSIAEHGFIFYRSDYLKIVGGCIFSMVASIIAIQMLIWQPFTGNSLFGVLGCGLIILFGLDMGFGRTWRDAHRRKRSLYAITNNRALIWLFGRKNRVTEIPLAKLEKCTLIERQNDGGTIVLGRDVRRWVGSSFYTTLAPRFELATNALWVYRLIEAVRNGTYWLNAEN